MSKDQAMATHKAQDLNWQRRALEGLSHGVGFRKSPLVWVENGQWVNGKSSKGRGWAPEATWACWRQR